MLGLLFLAVSQKVSAQLVVTSNADSGPGTLRQALSDAAASAGADVISFNLPPGQPITLLGQLDLVNDVTIDGTTQPGLPLGVINAKVKIRLSAGISFALRGVEVKNVSIFGLYIDRAYNAADNQESAAGISFINSKNIAIGAAGKGNIITNFGQSIDVRSGDFATEAQLCENVRISGNMAGLDPGGFEKCDLGYGGITCERIRNLTIGGNSPQDGNKVAGRIRYREVSNALITGELVVKNNVVGLTSDGTTAVQAFPFTNFNYEVNIASLALEKCEIQSNVFSGLNSSLVLNVNCYFRIQGNKFGSDYSGNNRIGNAHSAILLNSCAGGGLIGGGTATEGNLVTGCFQHKYGGFREFGNIENNGSAYIEVRGNSFRCNEHAYEYAIKQGTPPIGQVVATVTSRTASRIAGTATAGSRVDLYYSKSGGCTNAACEPDEMFASVMANGAGNWNYNGTVDGFNVIVAATLISGSNKSQTSGFTSIHSDYKESEVKKTDVCGTTKGSIKGIKYQNALSYTWYNQLNEVIQQGSDPDITGLGVGIYSLEVGDGFCTTKTDFYQIADVSVKTDFTRQAVDEAVCNQANGNIKGISSAGNTAAWRDKNNVIVGTAFDLAGVKAGRYTLTVTNPTTGCSATYPPVIVPVAGDPTLDERQAAVTDVTCELQNGAIRGINVNVAGSYIYTWRNQDGDIVNPASKSVPDVRDLGPGKYTLEVSGAGICITNPLFSKQYEVLSTGVIVFNISKRELTAAKCDGTGGSVTGITVTGANRYVWRDVAGAELSTNLDLAGVPAGQYYLSAYGDAGCTKRISVIIPQDMPAAYAFTDQVVPAGCGLNNGSITVDFGARMPKAVRWLNSSGTVISTASSLTGLKEGIYRMQLTSDNGCEAIAKTYILERVDFPKINVAAAIPVNDKCSTGKGGVRNIYVNGGVKPYVYQWKNAAGVLVGTQADLANVRAGEYTLFVTDASGNSCNQDRHTFVLADQLDGLPAPTVPDVTVCAPGRVLIHVLNPVAATYYLYKEAGGVPVAQSNTGVFEVNIAADGFYYVDYATGPCKSDPSALEVHVTDKEFKISASFTPNGDGINDTWQISNIQNYTNANIRVFNRMGELVFHSINYSQPFNGKSRGTDLPQGTYYYLVDLQKGCKTFAGSLTLVR
ncbi:gliding motility-associated C-terminal domain-containing protein [Hufsiella ginkgonis]|uniref:T9SS type B sorting domain-containing protein n=1 Tax=Hufsiella ginkgonis TaxID=2695274 RepID=A0A7K1Y261_9SPHI|nr:gliding motility-associated C-terminal domain-containing protein [Hufsiella ginkgonis]MXV17335.1 T9SS type B sorting domain-containing protein [Hufsiella ginkgonis]